MKEKAIHLMLDALNANMPGLSLLPNQRLMRNAAECVTDQFLSSLVKNLSSNGQPRSYFDEFSDSTLAESFLGSLQKCREDVLEGIKNELF